MNTIAIVGGGIAGLSVAHAIRRRDPEARLLVLERSARPGGNIRTEVVDGYMCEWGPDGFLDNAPATLALVNAVGLESDLRPSNDAARRRFIFRRGRLHEVPVSPGAFLTTGLLSTRAKLRIFGEPFAPRRPEQDETIFDFAARRIGSEAASVLIDSMVSGIFAGDARALSLRACFPRMWQLETDYGSLFRALIATRKQRRKDDAVGAPAGRLTSFDDGMERLITGLCRALPGVVRASAGVHALAKERRTESDPATYLVSSGQNTVEADAVVLTGPASNTATLVQPFDSTLAALLDSIPSASIAVVCLGYDERALSEDRGPLDGFGFLIPRSEGVRILGALWETSIYPKRAPQGKALLRVMIGGALDPRAVALEDGELLRIVREDLEKTMGLRVAPEFVRVIRHVRGIPQYNVGHLALLQRVDTLLKAHPGLFLAGNSYRGVAINACIAEADAIAERVLAHVGERWHHERLAPTVH